MDNAAGAGAHPLPLQGEQNYNPTRAREMSFGAEPAHQTRGCKWHIKTHARCSLRSFSCAAPLISYRYIDTACIFISRPFRSTWEPRRKHHRDYNTINSLLCQWRALLLPPQPLCNFKQVVSLCAQPTECAEAPYLKLVNPFACCFYIHEFMLYRQLCDIDIF